MPFDPGAGNVLAMEQGGGWFRDVVSELHTSGLPLNAHSNGLEKFRLVKSGPGLLFGFSAKSTNVAAQFILVFDSHDQPGAGAVPDAVFDVGAANTVAVSYIFPGRFHKYGIWLANSTTAATLTAGAADTFFDAQFV